MIEDEDQTEQDPLMDDNDDDGNGKEEDESEADAEMSDEYISSSGSGGKRRGKQQQRIEKEHYYAFTPPTPATMNKPSRQPMMGVNISTLSGDHFNLFPLYYLHILQWATSFMDRLDWLNT